MTSGEIRLVQAKYAAASNGTDLAEEIAISTLLVQWEIALQLALTNEGVRNRAIDETLAIYERDFERNAVVQDTIDAIKALRKP